MFKFLFSVAALFSLFFPTLISPAAAYARRCADEPPSTLLSLYRSSDAIYLGKFDKTTEGEIVAQEENYSTVSVSDHFSISSTLKGKSRKFFVRTYEQYRYRSQNAEETPEEEEYDDSYKPIKPGDTVLLFLKFSDEDEEGNKKKKTLDVAHYRDAIKRMDPEDVASYRSRIKDLNKIFSSKKPDDAAILNWLIRCIEDPATRWEGAFELLEAFETLEWKDQQENEKAELKEAAEEGGYVDGEEAVVKEEYETEEEFDNSVYARLLTPQQKDRLAEIALSAAPKKAEGNEKADDTSEIVEETADFSEGEQKTAAISEGDRILLNLVKRWGDSRLARVMLDRLAVSNDNWDKAQWMSSIADVLKDDELSELSEKFGDVTWQEDDAVIEETKESKTKESAEPEGEGEKDQPAAIEPVEYEMAGQADDAPARKTYKQFRDELFAGFINRANVVLANETKDDEAK